MHILFRGKIVVGGRGSTDPRKDRGQKCTFLLEATPFFVVLNEESLSILNRPMLNALGLNVPYLVESS
jgi:hypothetical protein